MSDHRAESSPRTLLITGATGNVGGRVVARARAAGFDVRVASRRPAPGDASAVRFDFTDPDTYEAALSGITHLFLMRPPQIAHVARDVEPFLDAVARSSVTRVAFLSLQGAENKSYLPHRKIEKAIERRNIDAVFLRPSFFMENLSTTHRDEIAARGEIVAPSGAGRLNFVASDDIAAAAIALLVAEHAKAAVTLTGEKNYSLAEVASLMSEVLAKPVRHRDPGPVRFFLEKLRGGAKAGYAAVMTLLYAAARFGREPETSGDFEQTTGRRPLTLRRFVEENRSAWTM